MTAYERVEFKSESGIKQGIIVSEGLIGNDFFALVRLDDGTREKVVSSGCKFLRYEFAGGIRS